jgi:uncharacterized protein YkwD
MRLARLLPILAIIYSLWAFMAPDSRPSMAQTGVRYQFSATPSAGVAPLTVRFEARVEGTVSGRTEFSWDFGDGSSATGGDVLHTFYRPGDYEVRLTASDGTGRSTGKLSIRVLSAGVERARIVALADDGLNWSFDGRASVVYGSEARYLWRFGDGSTASGPVVSRRLVPGSQVVRLEVTTASGQLRQDINIRPQALAVSDQFQPKLLELVNQARRQGWDCASQRFTGWVSLPALVRQPQLERAARAHAVAMALHGFFAHDSAMDTSTAAERVTAAGYRWQATAENLAKGQTSAEQVVDGWLRSPGHCKNIMNPTMSEIGQATVRSSTGEWHWVQVFGKPQ